MVLIAFLLVTVALSFVRGRANEPFGASMAIEPGFATLLLFYGYLDGAFEPRVTLATFLLGWVLPVVGACLAAFGAGRLLARFR